MRYVSTRGGVEPLSFGDAVMMGLAEDGGLLIPESVPDVREEMPSWRELDYPDLALRVMRRFATDVPQDELEALIGRTYGERFGGPVAPTVEVGPLHLVELWHGPTLAFKDVALQLLGNLFEHLLALRGEELNVLGATSGDTGSAAIAGCRNRAGIRIFILHPHGGVSPVQRLQMTTVLDENVHNIAIEGSFDDCQSIVKELASDLQFKKLYSLGAVNSINWARVMAQIVYYFKAVFDVQAHTGAQAVEVAVPTGNFGNVLAGWYAMRMGLPIERLLLATNENDILARFFTSGRYERGSVTRTLAPAMDIQAPSNFERYLYYRVGCDPERVRRLMRTLETEGAFALENAEGGPVDPDIAAGAGATEDCLAAIRRYHREHDYLLDPHTAVGVAVAERLRSGHRPTICLATAHPAKFPEAVAQAVGRDIARHPAIEALKGKPTRCEVLPNDKEAVRRFIVRAVG